MPTLNGSCPGSRRRYRPSPPWYAASRLTDASTTPRDQPPTAGHDRAALSPSTAPRPLRRRVTVQPPHGDMDANAQRPLPWFTVSVPSQPPVSVVAKAGMPNGYCTSCKDVSRLKFFCFLTGAIDIEVTQNYYQGTRDRKKSPNFDEETLRKHDPQHLLLPLKRPAATPPNLV
ncbi:uncharacterized protein LACBIDRAFT_331693 [Laccaria bicolor S238N-H82]|uniref:Predicted protein n=1 Tax=Laccaria bicolor (strain S238N-H82 / ATCC MYA-4686) TaxID=486041 RepID=B0DQ97_LACBS|nr:uncharacterized protein LACBIDRAFT_331693 [Laccaria bicolor S238N-H82]EDR03345.1 predicted protein [Laccaria bicolor S238N-H82]|eukprot:XP_001886141.1 predicted protein [Laccaria bicolor S238N-H82]